MQGKSIDGNFVCDICGRELPGGENSDSWFTAASELGDKSLRLFRWPTGSRLRESHQALFHVCSTSCLQSLIARWSEKSF